VSLTVAACGSSSTGTSSTGAAASSTAQTSSTAATAAGSDVVKTASSAKLGTVLVDAQGMTLYRLTGERSGKFLCTAAACVGAWHPLAAPANGVSGAGVGSLATVKRPEGAEQVAYRGEPLYTFVGDKAAGEVNGQGLKSDGSTWEAVSTSGTQTSSTSTSGTAAAAGAANEPSGESPSTSESSGGGESSSKGSGGGYAY